MSMNMSYQIVFMLLNNLSDSFRYDEFEKNVIDQLSGFAGASSFRPPADAMSQIPAEFPRRIINGESASAQITQNSISFNYVFQTASTELLSIIEKTIDELTTVIRPIGKEEHLKYRLGIIITIPMSIDDVKKKISYLQEEVYSNPEVEFSYLTTTEDNKVMNTWRRFYINNNNDEAVFILDCNNSSSTPYYLNEKDVKEVYREEYKPLIEVEL